MFFLLLGITKYCNLGGVENLEKFCFGPQLFRVPMMMCCGIYMYVCFPLCVEDLEEVRSSFTHAFSFHFNDSTADLHISCQLDITYLLEMYNGWCFGQHLKC